MALGIFLLLIFILYLIDTHNRWRQAVKVTAALIGLGVLGAGSLFGWQKYESWQEANREAQRQAAEAKQDAQKQAELGKTCMAWEDKHPGNKEWEDVEDPPQGCEGPLETAYQERSGPWNDYAKTVKVPNHKQFGNGHIAPDSAILFNGGTMITTVFFGSRVKVLGEGTYGYRVQIVDGRKGELNKEEVELDKGVVITADPN